MIKYELKASIDIGSNTILLLIAEVKDGKLNTIYEEQRTPRLGKGVDASGNLHPESMQKAIQALMKYKNIIEGEYDQVSDTIVTATSAVRDAANKAEFLAAIKEDAGFEVQLLSGEEEAELTYCGALSTLAERKEPSLVIDIGGGSTELCYGNSQSVTDRHSFQMGSVRFTEKYFFKKSYTFSEVDNCRSATGKLLKKRNFTVDSSTELVGVAGTVTSLAHILGGYEEYKPIQINNSLLTIEQVITAIDGFVTYGSDYYLEKYPRVMKGRSDVFLGGLLILEQVMLYFEKFQVRVSSGGIRHGAILKNFL